MVKKIANHHITKYTMKTFRFIVSMLLLIIVPLVVFTFLSSKGLIGGIQSFTVLTGSMEPVLAPGSVVYTHKQQFYREGEVITFTNNVGDIVTHRIADVVFEGGVITYLTRGDANSVDDSEKVLLNNVIGSVQLSLPYLGYIIAGLRTLPGLIGIIVIPGLVFIGFELVIIKREIERQAEERLLAKLQQTV